MAYKKIPAVYEIVHVASGRRYVGAAASIKARWQNHRFRLKHGNHHCKPLQQTWSDFGITAFEFRIVEVCAPERLVEREQAYLDTVAAEQRFNIYLTAGSPRGHKHTAERRQQVRDQIVSMWDDAEHRERMKRKHRELWKDDDYRQKIMAARNTPEVKEKMRRAAQQREQRKRLNHSLSVDKYSGEWG